MIELIVEGSKVDIDEGFSTLLTLAIDDIKDFGAKNTTFSKTIIIPGTKRNNKLFGNIFNVNASSDYEPASKNIGYNFNASVGARAYIFSSNMQIFKGVFRLLSITIDDGFIDYECAVFGELGGFLAKLGNLKLEELDFSANDHTYNLTNIVNSWDGTRGYYYPLIDYGNYSAAKKDWQVKTLRPALYVKDYIDKIFSASGYTYDCDLFNTNRFKSLIIPHNQKILTKVSSTSLSATPKVMTYSSSGSSMTLEFSSTALGAFTLGSGDTAFTNTGATFTTNFLLNLTGRWVAGGSATINIRKNGTVIGSTLLGSAGAFMYFTRIVTAYGVTVNTSDVITFTLDWSPSQSYNLEVLSGSFSLTGGTSSVIVPVNYGESLQLNMAIPKNILQKDFISSIVKLFNLYLYEDDQDKVLKISPFPDFYSSSTITDWTLKVDRAKPIVLTPMSELNARYFNFEYKSDSDYYSDLYKKRYNQNYGSYKYDSAFEFANEEKKIELIFAATPLVGYASEAKVYPTIFKRTGDTPGSGEEQIDSVIRILQTKVIEGVPSWDILNGASVLGSYTSYPYAGHYDDPDSPGVDLNFGKPSEIFFTAVSGDFDATQFYNYWSAYMTEITDKDSKLLECTMRLSNKDIYSLDFSTLVIVDGALFRLNKIIDFNATEPNTCKVQLLKVLNLAGVTILGDDYNYTYTGLGTEGTSLFVSALVGKTPILVYKGTMPLAKVVGTPGVNEYSFTAGTFTFGTEIEENQVIQIIYN